MYKQIDVWKKRRCEGVICYRCLEDIVNGGFFVQSADFFYKGSTAKPQQDSLLHFVELFSEEDPAERTQRYPSLHEAIEAHNREFDDIEF